MGKPGDHLERGCLIAFNHLNEKLLQDFLPGASVLKSRTHDMINTRADLTASRSISKSSTSGLGTLEPHGRLLGMTAGKVCGAEGMFPAWEFSSTRSCELLSHQCSLDNALARGPLSCPSFRAEELLSPPPLSICTDFGKNISCTLQTYFISLRLEGKHFI